MIVRKKIVAKVAIAALTISGLGMSYSDSVSATGSLNEVRKQIKSLEEQKRDANKKEDAVESKQDQIQGKINSNAAQQAEINRQIKSLDDQVYKTQKELEEKEVEIIRTEGEIEQKLVLIAEMEERIKVRNELLMDRFRNLQKNGSVSYLEVIMGAKSFGDFLQRATAVNKIMGQDKKIMEEHTAEKLLLEETKQQLEKQKADLLKQKKDLDALKVQLERQVQYKKELIERLKKEASELHEYKLQLQEEEEIVRKQKAVIAKMIAAAKKEEERIKEEQRRQQQQQQTPVVNSNAGFVRPYTSGRITSNYGVRWNKQHAGIDIGRSSYSAPSPAILAAAPGTVTRSYYSTSYGHVVFITHYMNGKIYTTVYAHMTHREVSEGQYVKQGHRLGVMGTTGNSTGIHLHFELHEGSWLPNKANAVDPRRYIKF